MKKKYLTLSAGVLSAMLAAIYAIVTIICIFSIKAIALKIQDTTDDLNGFELIKFAGLSYIMAILGIILAVCFAGLRASASYYYIKIFTSDEKFFKERRMGIFGFALLCVIMIVVYSFVLKMDFDIVPDNINWVIILAIVLYSLVALLSVVDLVVGVILDILSKLKADNVVPTENEISSELDMLSEEATSTVRGQGDERQVEEVQEENERDEELKDDEQENLNEQEQIQCEEQENLNEQEQIQCDEQENLTRREDEEIKDDEAEVLGKEKEKSQEDKVQEILDNQDGEERQN